MTRRYANKLTKRQLEEKAHLQNVDPDQPYEDLRKEMNIKKCKWCDAEYIAGWSDQFCSDQCEVDYIHEYHR